MPRDRSINVGLVGAGHISRFHLEALRRLPHVRVVGITDVDRERAQEVARRWSVRRVDSLAALASAGASVIHVLTPPATHADVTLAAIEAGCDVYVEKPLATSVADCERIAAAAALRGRSVCVGHSLLRDPFVFRALHLARSGAIGDLLTVDYFRCQSSPPYAGGRLPEYYRDGGHPFRDLGIHALYLIEAFLGDIRDAHAAFNGTGRQPHLFADEWRVLVHCARGAGQIQLSWNVRPQQNLLIVQGTHGVMRVDLFGMSVSIKRAGKMPEHAARIFNALDESRQIATQTAVNPLRVLTGKLRRFHGLQTLVAEFYDSLTEGRPAPITPAAVCNVVDWTERIARRADVAKQARLQVYAGPLSAKVLVTGAAGFVGRHLVRRLIAEGKRVRVLVRRDPPDDWLTCGQIEVVLGDLGDPDAVDRAVEGIETIYHVGATMRGAAHDFERGTVIGTRNVVESALTHGVNKLIHISSLSVLHSLAIRSDRFITEAWPVEPYPERRGQYTRTKCAAENYVFDAMHARGLRAIILRPGEVVGADAPLITSGIAQRRGDRLIVLGDGRLTVPAVYIEDLIDAIHAAGRRDVSDGVVLHIVDPASPTQNDIITRYLSITQRSLRVRHIPRWLMCALSAAFQCICVVLRRPALVSLYRVRSALAPRSFQCSAATEYLGWTPAIGMEVGLQFALAGKSPKSIDQIAASSDLEVATKPLAAFDNAELTRPR